MTWGVTAIVGTSLVTGAMGANSASSQSDASAQSTKDSLAEQKRQFDLQRGDSAPYREAGVNALGDLQGGLRAGDYTPNQFNYQGGQPEGAPLPEFAGGNRFNFNLEEDQGYQFARDQGIKYANREAAAGGSYNSGNRLAEIADRVTGIASQYADQAFNRQMGASKENYGRDVSEYGINYGREQDIYGRDVSREASDYGRSLTGYGLGRENQQDAYGQNQNYLNRLSSIAGLGQTANAQSAAAGSSMANAVAGINQANALGQANAANTRYGSINNAVQGGVSNYLTYQGINNNMVPAGGRGGVQATGYGGVPPGGAFPPSQMYG